MMEKTPRKQPKDTRRAQLIEATIDAMAERGFARTTMSDVAAKAGLSHGLVNFHFESKDKLLLETLLYLSQEYRRNWVQALRDAPTDAPSQLLALFRADFVPEICTPARLAAWFGFWAEAQGRPLYQERCHANDAEYDAVLNRLCQRMSLELGYGADPVQIARVLNVTAQGAWLEMLNRRESFGPNEGIATMLTCAASFYPRHFQAN